MLITTEGPKQASELGLILPHEHIFVDLRQGGPPGFAQAEPQAVIDLMAPQLEAAKQAGVTALVECTPEGVGRRADLVAAAARAAQMPVVIPTGIYREPWIPDWAVEAPTQQIAEWMLGELTGEIAETGQQAAWIKISAGDDGLTALETRILRAAAQAGRQTGAVIGSHTIRGRVVRDQLDIIEREGYTASRFIWIHTQAETDFDLHLEMAGRGAWIEYDWIGNAVSDEQYISYIQRLLDAGYGEQILLSHDRGWYDPAQPNGGTPQPFTYLSETFLPKLRAAGLDEATVRQLTHTNPFRAFARDN